MTWQTLDLRPDPRGVLHVTLNLPDRRNVLSPAMIAELTKLAQGPGKDLSTRAIVLSGAGPVFCAGGDLAWMQSQIDATRDQRLREARKLAEMLQVCTVASLAEASGSPASATWRSPPRGRSSPSQRRGWGSSRPSSDPM